ncbi:hypothetical protein CK203_116607 [Vitis vinifera]|uniref:SWIM-type domain-containing protein n=1 Tax=Vitis vinifera TaxID=29760 RepID=A0A438C8K5_VITVI|nr:hypothetical protein CK203_116607 [Vitis vinifera]
MDESPLSLPGNSPSMPNVQAPQSQYDFIEADGQSEIANVPIDVEDDEDDEDYNLSDFSESDDDIIEDFGMEGDEINRAIGGKQLEGVWNGEGDSDHGDSDELRSAEGSFDDERNSRPRFPEFNQHIGMENVQLVKDQKFASHVIFKEALKEWWLANKYLPFFRDDHTWTANALKGVVFRDHEVDVTLDQCYKAKRMAFKMIHGAEEKQYERLWDYAAAIRKGFLEGCRPLIGIDGCHLKGTTGGQLLVAVGKDGNDNIFPIAFAIVEIENKSSWTWFLQCLLDDIGHVDENGWGLVETFKDLMPNAEHRFCVRHLHANFKKDFPGKVLKDAMWSAARATTKNYFDFHMDELKKLDVKAYEWLVKLDVRTWSRHAFNPRSKSDTLVNNIAESFNAWILEARDKPVLTMMEIIRVMLMQRLQTKRDHMRRYEGRVCPRIYKKLERIKSEVGHCISRWNGESKYEVEYIYGGRYVVDLDERACGCGRWGLSGIPCFHAAAAIIEHGEQLETYVDIAYTKETFLIGKHKKVRKREAGEPINAFRVSKKGTAMKCGNCFQWGHNQRTCKALDNPNKKAYKKKKKGQLEQSSASGAKGSKKLLGTQQSNIGTQQSSQSRTKDNTSGSKKDKGKAKV